MSSHRTKVNRPAKLGSGLHLDCVLRTQLLIGKEFPLGGRGEYSGFQLTWIIEGHFGEPGPPLPLVLGK